MKRPTPNTEHLRGKLKRFSDQGLATGVVSLYLFGSHNQERGHRDSDIDLGVLLHRGSFPSAKDRFELAVSLTSELIHALGCNEIDLVVLNDAPPLLARRILEEGSRVYCVDRDLDRDFRRDVQLRAADLAPYLERHRRTKLEALGVRR